MALLLCHSPKGGVGTSFIAAQLSILLAERGHEVTALDFTYQDALKLYFGLLPAHKLPDMASHAGEATVVSGVELLSAHEPARDPAFARRLSEEGGAKPFGGERIYIADVAAGDRDTKALLFPHALLHICPLHPRPGSLAALPMVQPGTPTIELEKTVFVLNHLDDTHRFSRHSHVFLRELVGDRLIGTVRRDEAVNEAAAMFEPISRFAPNSVALADLVRLAAAVEQRCGIAKTAEAQP